MPYKMWMEQSPGPRLCGFEFCQGQGPSKPQFPV